MPPESKQPETRDDGKVSQRRRRSNSSRRAFRILFIGVLTLVLGGIGFRLVYPITKEWRARRVAAEAGLLLDASKREEALPLLKVATVLAPNEPAVIRARARYYTQVGAPEAVREWQTLADSGKATLEDKIQLLETAVAARRLDLSAPILTQLAPLQSTNRRVLHLGIRHLTEGGFVDRATEMARYAYSRDPLDVENQFLLGGLILSSTNETLATEGRTLLTSVARTANKKQAAALDLLIRSGRVTSNDVPELIALVDLDRNNITNFVNSLELRWIGYADRHDDLVEKASQFITTESDASKLMPVTDWLARRNPDALVKALTEEKAGTAPGLVSQRAEALSITGKWGDLEDYVRRHEANIPAFSTMVLRAKIAVSKGQTSDAEKLFIAAGDLVSKQPGAVIYTARAAETAGLADAAIKIWTKLLDFNQTTLGAASEIVRIARDRDRLDAELAALAKLSDQVPGDERLAAERGEREALLGVNLKAAAESLEHYMTSAKKERKYVTALALIRLRQGDANTAQTVFEQLPVEWDSFSNRDRVVYVAIIGANQQREAARRFARQIDITKLKSQEKELLSPWL